MGGPPPCLAEDTTQCEREESLAERMLLPGPAVVSVQLKFGLGWVFSFFLGFEGLDWGGTP